MPHRPANTVPREIEFKFSVANPQALRQLTEHLGLPEDRVNRGVVQRNHFFDTPARALRSGGAIVRLREQARTYTLTVKAMGPAESAQAALSERSEYETPMAAVSARAVLSAQTLPLDTLRALFSAHSEAIAALLTRCAVAQDLHCLGYFENTRTTLPITLQVDRRQHALVMEFDTSVFPGCPPAYEIEVEIPSREHAHGIQKALEQLLAQAGISWRTTTNKAARFFAALDAQGHHQDHHPGP